MMTDQVQEVLQRQPFRPFVLHLADGRSINVISREFTIMLPKSRTLVVAHPDERVSIVDLLMVTELELQTPGKGTRGRGRGNGSQSRR